MRTEVTDHPMQMLVRCNRPHLLAASLFAADHVVEVASIPTAGACSVRTRDAAAFHRQLNGS